MRLIKTAYILIGLATCLVQTSFASDCGQRSKSQPTPTAGEQRIVLLELNLKRSGGVRATTVLSGPAALVPDAIRAARRRKYGNYVTERTILVSVTFAANSNTVTDIREAVIGGVPGHVSTPTMVRVSQEVMQKLLISRVAPEYPPEARRERIEGTVVLRLFIERDGTVWKVAEKVSGPDIFVKAATDAVKQWRFRPYYVNGEAVKVETVMDVKFVL